MFDGRWKEKDPSSSSINSLSGYDRNDPSTYHAHMLPTVSRGGLVNLYGVGQEQFAWDVRSVESSDGGGIAVSETRERSRLSLSFPPLSRQEQGIIDVFSKIWGTEELLVSMGE